MWYSDPGGGPVPRTSELSPSGYGEPSFNFPIVAGAENAFIMAEAQFAASNEAGAISAAQDGLTCQEDEWSVDLSATADPERQRPSRLLSRSQHELWGWSSSYRAASPVLPCF